MIGVASGSQESEQFKSHTAFKDREWISYQRSATAPEYVRDKIDIVVSTEIDCSHVTIIFSVDTP